MDVGEANEVQKVLDSCLPLVKWRLRPASKRRLGKDILALCTRMRPVVMVDYGGKLPELQEHLCQLVGLAHEASPIFLPIRVMVIDEMIYMVHIIELSEHAISGTTLQPKTLFVDLEKNPPKILLQVEQSNLAQEFISIQKSFLSYFSYHSSKETSSSMERNTDSSEYMVSNISRCSDNVVIHFPNLIDLSCCLKDKNVTIPTLNGWLLGYPVVYLFGKDHIEDAVYNLSTESLHLYRIMVGRNKSGKVPCEEELLSFSVPYDLSLEGDKEPWAVSFLAHMMAKFERCKHAWAYLRLEVNACYPQAIVL